MILDETRVVKYSPNRNTDDLMFYMICLAVRVSEVWVILEATWPHSASQGQETTFFVKIFLMNKVEYC